MQGGTVSLRLSVREVERKEWLGGGIGGVLGKLSFLCLTTEVFHVPNFSFFTTDWESGSNFKQYSHVTNILSYQGLNMFLINS